MLVYALVSSAHTYYKLSNKQTNGNAVENLNRQPFCSQKKDRPSHTQNTEHARIVLSHTHMRNRIE